MMKRELYLELLREKLRGLDEKEIEDAISYCNEYLDEAGEENEEQAMEELGSPAKFAAQIRAESIIKNDTVQKQSQTNASYENMNKKRNSSVKNIWMIILGIFALPIALPLAFALFALIFALMLAAAALVFAVVVAVFALFTGGVIAIAKGIFSFDSSLSYSLMAIGLGLCSFGLSILLLLYVVPGVKKMIPQLSQFLAGIYKKFKRKKEVPYEDQ